MNPYRGMDEASQLRLEIADLKEQNARLEARALKAEKAASDKAKLAQLLLKAVSMRDSLANEIQALKEECEFLSARVPNSDKLLNLAGLRRKAG